VCTSKPFLEFLWCDDNCEPCTRNGTVETGGKNNEQREQKEFFFFGYSIKG